jgi:hypothetical protein
VAAGNVRRLLGQRHLRANQNISRLSGGVHRADPRRLIVGLGRATPAATTVLGCLMINTNCAPLVSDST